MTPTDLAAWMARHKINKSEAASLLGITRTTLRGFLDPYRTKPIPRHIALACAAYSHGIPPLGGTESER